MENTTQNQSPDQDQTQNNASKLPLTPKELFELIDRQCLPLSEAAKLTGYHEDYLGQRARLGQLKAIKIGRNWITSRHSLDDFCKTHSGPYPHRPGKIIRSRKKRSL